MTELTLGIKGLAQTKVTHENTAASMGSGAAEVFSTPHMIALMERAARLSVQPYLDEGKSTVGTHLDVSHLSAAPVGMEVRAESELTGVDGRFLTFSVKAWAGDELIGSGEHQRCIIDNARFMEKVNAKLK